MWAKLPFATRNQLPFSDQSCRLIQDCLVTQLSQKRPITLTPTGAVRVNPLTELPNILPRPRAAFGVGFGGNSPFTWRGWVVRAAFPIQQGAEESAQRKHAGAFFFGSPMRVDPSCIFGGHKYWEDRRRISLIVGRAKSLSVIHFQPRKLVQAYISGDQDTLMEVLWQ